MDLTSFMRLFPFFLFSFALTLKLQICTHFDHKTGVSSELIRRITYSGFKVFYRPTGNHGTILVLTLRWKRWDLGLVHACIGLHVEETTITTKVVTITISCHPLQNSHIVVPSPPPCKTQAQGFIHQLEKSTSHLNKCTSESLLLLLLPPGKTTGFCSLSAPPD